MKLEFENVVIVGMGRTGSACLEFFNNFYKKEFQHDIKIICVDSRPMSLDCLFFQETDVTLDQYLTTKSLLIWSPGISWETPFMKKCVSANMTIWSEIELAARFFTKPMMALTGTNGKTTTVSLIQHILLKSNTRSFLGGNIGTPFIEVIAKQDHFDVAVLELSSFQLEAIDQFHPQIAGILNLYQNHEERYSCFEDYVTAKANILKNLTSEDLFVRREFEQPLAKLVKNITCSKKLIPLNLVKESPFWEDLNIDLFPLVGTHNLENLAMAKLFLNQWGITNSQIENAMQDFKAVPFRLQEIYKFNKYSIYNDSKSTNWDATNIALKSFSHTSKPVLLMGGQLRDDQDEKDLSSQIEFISESVKLLIVFGEAGSTLSNLFNGKVDLVLVHTLEEAFDHLKDKAIISSKEPKDHILFSPGYPSFDSYENYVKRGEHFNELVDLVLVSGE
jgi:UDP-N-acetylmuramoylalanine--D-glutamate ligase